MLQEKIFEYDSYRELLNDFLEAKKKEHEKFSHRYFISKLGVKSSGFLSEVINGKRSISNTHITILIGLLSLKHEQASYFESLVHFNQAKHPEDREYYFRKMIGFKPLKIQKIQPSQFEYYSSWYHTAIRELLWFEKKKTTPAQIAKRLMPSISISDAQSSLQLLLNLGFIKKDQNGYKISDIIVSSDKETRAIEILKYQEVTIDLAREALHKISPEQRDISTVSFSLSKEGFDKIKELVKSTRTRALKIAQQDSNEEKVYQFNIQFFPMSK